MMENVQATSEAPRVDLFDRHLRVYFAGKQPAQADFHYQWLRHNCDGDLHPLTRERLLDSSEFPANIRAAEAHVDRERAALIVRWEGEARTSEYPLAWLSEHAYAVDAPLVLPPPSDLDAVTLSAAGLSDDEVARVALERVTRDGVVIVRGFRGSVDPESDTKRIVEALAALSLSVRSTHFGYIEDLRTDNTTNQNTDQLGYTSSAVGLHTDQPFLDVPPRYQLLQCLVAAPEGGENQVTDGLAAARYLEAHDAATYELLRSVNVRFHRKQRAFEAIVDSPVLVGEGEDFRVRSSYFTLAPYKLPFARMAAWYQAIDTFTRLIRDPRHQYRFKLSAGDFLFYDNWRMLHARSGFSGARWLRGIYFDRS